MQKCLTFFLVAMSLGYLHLQNSNPNAVRDADDINRDNQSHQNQKFPVYFWYLVIGEYWHELAVKMHELASVF